jgi:hypothetical protein
MLFDYIFLTSDRFLYPEDFKSRDSAEFLVMETLRAEIPQNF